MDFNLTREEMEVLEEQLETALKTLEIEAIRSDNRDYHRLLQKKAEMTERILEKVRHASPI